MLQSIVVLDFPNLDSCRSVYSCSICSMISFFLNSVSIRRLFIRKIQLLTLRLERPAKNGVLNEEEIIEKCSQKNAHPKRDLQESRFEKSRTRTIVYINWVVGRYTLLSGNANKINQSILGCVSRFFFIFISTALFL